MYYRENTATLFLVTIVASHVVNVRTSSDYICTFTNVYTKVWSSIFKFLCVHTYPLIQGCGLAILNVAVFAVLFTIGSICGIFRYMYIHVDNSERQGYKTAERQSNITPLTQKELAALGGTQTHGICFLGNALTN